MIEARCRTLTGQFSVIREAYEFEERLERVQGAVDSVVGLRQQADRASEILRTVSERVTDPEARAAIDNAVQIAAANRRQLASLCEELKKDENLLARKNHETYKSALRATANACDGLRRAAEQAWRDHARNCLSNDGPILEVFRKSNPTAVSNLKSLRRELLATSRVTSPSSDQIAGFDERIAAYSSAFRSLSGGDVPADVRDALQAAASPGGASIDLFSSEVVDWLQEGGLAEAFRVVARSAP